jgi:hypothetical protein
METKEPRTLNERYFALAETRRNVWLATVDDGVTEEDVLNHAFWSHNARHIRPSDEIIIVPVSGEWRMHLYVIRTDKLGADVALLHKHDFREMASEALDAGDALAVRWRGPHAQFGVVRKDSGQVVKDGFPTKEAAFDFIRDTAQAA